MILLKITLTDIGTYISIDNWHCSRSKMHATYLCRDYFSHRFFQDVARQIVHQRGHCVQIARSGRLDFEHTNMHHTYVM